MNEIEKLKIADLLEKYPFVESYFEENKLKGAILIGDVSKGITLIKSVRENAEKDVVLGKIYS